MLYSSPAAILPLNSRAPDSHTLSCSQTHAVSLLLRVPDSSFTNIVAEFLHAPLPSPLDSFFHIKVCLAASCRCSSSTITSAFRLRFTFDENLLNKLFLPATDADSFILDLYVVTSQIYPAACL